MMNHDGQESQRWQSSVLVRNPKYINLATCRSVLGIGPLPGSFNYFERLRKEDKLFIIMEFLQSSTSLIASDNCGLGRLAIPVNAALVIRP